MTDIPPTVGDVAAALKAAQPHATVLNDDYHDLAGPIIFARSDDHTVDWLDLERYLPEPARQRGDVTALSADGFVEAYRARTVETAEYGAPIYANPDTCRLVAVLNDDYGPHAGWRDHRIELALQPTPEWAHWTGHQGLGTQARFAEAIEDGEAEIRDPSPTVMLDLAQTFTASVGAKFVQKGRLKDGRRQLVYEEEIEATAGEGSGIAAIPDTFTIEVRPFYGAAPRLVTCRLRYRLERGVLTIGYTIPRPDEIRRDAFATDVVGHIREELPAANLIEGTPAAPTTPGR